MLRFQYVRHILLRRSQHVVKPFFYNVILWMIFWNMKYFFYNCLLLLLCCACCKLAIQTFVQEDKQAIQSKYAKTITAFCHNHRQQYRRTMTRRYFTESCKNITAPATISDGNTDDSDPSVFHRELQNNYSPCHNHRQQYRQILTHWYFTESCKKITALATITYGYTDASPTDISTPSPMDGAHSNAHDCQIVQSVGTVTDGCGKSNARVL